MPVDFKKRKYLEHMSDREWPENVQKAFTNCKTKLRHAVSKIVIEGNANDNIAKEVLDWCQETKPIVVQKEKK